MGNLGRSTRLLSLAFFVAGGRAADTSFAERARASGTPQKKTVELDEMMLGQLGAIDHAVE
ncbi:MAG: hypothetical protein R3F35_23420 [Myxococcota bacterium]